MSHQNTPPVDLQIPGPFEWQEAYKHGIQEVAEFYASACWNWGRVALDETVADSGKLGREEINEWRGFLRPFAPDAALLHPLDELSNPNTHAVVTGQQAGAALGPLYTLYKALAAKHWAERIAAKSGAPVLPVFWIASDDHDLAEIEQVTWLGNDGTLQKYSLALEDTPRHQSIFHTPVSPDRVDVLLEKLQQTTVSSEFRGPILESVRQALAASGTTFESQFLRLFCSWLLQLGILPIVPRLSFIRRKAARLIRREIDSAPRTNELVIEESARIARLGLEPPVRRKGNEINFFLEIDGIRGKVVHKGGRFHVRRPGQGKEPLADFDKRELLALLEGHPERFSPNALLRPLVQDDVLPTIVYIAGSAELVYHAQIRKLYHHFGVPRPAIFPRPNVALLDTRGEKALERLGLTREAARVTTSERLSELLKSPPPDSRLLDDVKKHLADLEGTMHALSSLLEGAMRDTGVEKAMEKLHDGTRTAGERLRERMEAHLESLDSDRVRARELLSGLLFPDGMLQERGVGVLSPLMIQYGTDILPALYRSINYKAEGIQALSLRDIQKSETRMEEE